MPYIHIRDFKTGMDRTRDALNASADTLRVLKNAHITRGGDAERAKRFAPAFSVPGTKGYYAANGKHYVFSSSPVAVPAGVVLQVLAHPSGAVPIEKILDVEARDGKLYVIARFLDGTIHHYFDRSRVTDWDLLTLAGGFGSLAEATAGLASRIDDDISYSASAANNVITITGAEGIAFAYSGAVDDQAGVGDASIGFALVQAAGVPIPEIRAKGYFRIASGSPGSLPATGWIRYSVPPDFAFNGAITSLLAGATELLGYPVPYSFDGSNSEGDAEALALDVVGSINSASGVHGYSASTTPANNRVNISSPAGAAYNGLNVFTTMSGDQLFTATQALSGGQDPVNRVTSVTVNGVEVLGADVYFGASANATAIAVAAQINALSSAPEYTAAVVNGNVIEILAAAGTGAGPNGFAVAAQVSGGITLDNFAAFSGGRNAGSVTAQTIAATLLGTFDARNSYTITLDGQDFVISVAQTGIGTTAFLYKSKIHTTGLSIVRFSSIDNPKSFTDLAGGAGYINISAGRSGDTDLVGMGEFQNLAAIFSRTNIQLYSLNEDDNLNSYVSSVENTGTIAHKSITGFGNKDLFYLDATGVRSLRARSVNASAYTEDVGTALDPFIIEYMQTLTPDQMEDVAGFIEPEAGRFWLGMGSRIFVFTYFASKQISAWSYYEPGFSPCAFGRVGDKAFVRGHNDVIYAYGGASGSEYPDADEAPAVVETPFLDANDPEAMKSYNHVNISAVGAWRLDAAYSRQMPDEFSPVSYFEGDSFDSGGRHPIEHRAPAIALRFTSTGAGPAKLSAIALHHEPVSGVV